MSDKIALVSCSGLSPPWFGSKSCYGGISSG